MFDTICPPNGPNIDTATPFTPILTAPVTPSVANLDISSTKSLVRLSLNLRLVFLLSQFFRIGVVIGFGAVERWVVRGIDLSV